MIQVVFYIGRLYLKKFFFIKGENKLQREIICYSYLNCDYIDRSIFIKYVFGILLYDK